MKYVTKIVGIYFVPNQWKVFCRSGSGMILIIPKCNFQNAPVIQFLSQSLEVKSLQIIRFDCFA